MFNIITSKTRAKVRREIVKSGRRTCRADGRPVVDTDARYPVNIPTPPVPAGASGPPDHLPAIDRMHNRFVEHEKKVAGDPSSEKISKLRKRAEKHAKRNDIHNKRI